MLPLPLLLSAALKTGVASAASIAREIEGAKVHHPPALNQPEICNGNFYCLTCVPEK